MWEKCGVKDVEKESEIGRRGGDKGAELDR